jgi:hypothetical protein
MNEITWHESAIWFFIAQKLLFANQYVRKFPNYKIKKKFKLKVKCFLSKFQDFKNYTTNVWPTIYCTRGEHTNHYTTNVWPTIYCTLGEHTNHYTTNVWPTIYCTRGEHTNHYTTNVVMWCRSTKLDRYVKCYIGHVGEIISLWLLLEVHSSWPL